MNDNTRNRAGQALAILLLAVLTVLLWTLIVSPRFATAAETNAAAESRESLNTATETRIHNLETRLAEAEATIEEARALSAAFPADADQASLLRQVTAAAGASGINGNNVTALNPGAPVVTSGSDGSAQLPGYGTGTDIATMPVTVSVTATDKTAIDFLGRLQNMNRTYVIDTVQVSGQERGQWTTQVNGNMFLLRQDNLDQVIEQVRALRR